MESLFEQIRNYAEHFPFVGYTDESIDAIQTRLRTKLPSLLTHCFRFIGEGYFELTGGYFHCDVDGSCTEMLRQELSAAETPSQVSPDLQFVKQPDWGNLMYIGGRDFFFNFIELDGTKDPVVYTCFEHLGLHCDSSLLSYIVQSFKAFTDPKRIPQSLVDEYWFSQTVFKEERPNAFESQTKYIALRESAFLKWKGLGRPGLPDKYRIMAEDDAALQEGRILLNY